MRLYQIDPHTRECLGSRPAQVDPLETAAAGHAVYTEPGPGETVIEPPATGANEVAVFSGEVWEIVPDHRGEVWWTAEGDLVHVDCIGDPALTGLTLAPPPAAVADARNRRIAEAWAESERRLAEYIVTVAIGGSLQPFGCDLTTRENIIGINSLIDKERGGLLPAGTIPNPRSWTPKGALLPVSVTHAEFARIGAALAAAKEQYFIAYAAHKIQLSALSDIPTIAAYDLSQGWPG